VKGAAAVRAMSEGEEHNRAMFRRLRFIVSISGASRLGRLLLSGLLLLGQVLPLNLLPGNVALAACAAPGTSGAGGTLSGIVNIYFASPASAAVVAGAISLPLGAVSGAGSIRVGDELLIVQMQGGALNTSNSLAYGANTGAGHGAGSYTAGRYEYVVATSAGAAGGAVSIRGAGTGNGTVNAYASALATATAPRQSYQVVVVPQYSTATLSSALSIKRWDGASGGILALDVAGKLMLGGTVDLSGLGFRGGGGRQLGGAASGASNSDYLNLSTVNAQASKGEGAAGTPRYTYASGDAVIVDNAVANGATNPEGYPGGSTAMGGPGNAGGGGTDGRPSANDENSGGGGGGNGGLGGRGGRTWNSNLDLGGVGGDSVPYSVSRLFLGGGGGAGTRNNSAGAQSSGGSGGGMALIRAGSVSGAGTILANGAVGLEPANDGGGGGGAGGSILFYAAVSSGASLTLNALGGRGTNADVASTNQPHGPGGGGGGGVVLTNVAASLSAAGGANGTTESNAQVYGAAPGTVGSTSTGLVRANIVGLTPADACTPAATAPTITKQQANTSTGSTLGSGLITVKPGNNIRYVLTASNNTFTTATSLVFRDPLDARLNVPASGQLTCPDGTLRTVTLGSASISVNVVASCGMNLNPGQSAVLDFSATVK
jgi:uncharacterized repeat protein (TIGR01451 family)